MEPVGALKRTPFHAFHKSAGAKLVDFAGFEMPLRYKGDVHEHRLVRAAAGLFDISHMGEFEVRGPGSEKFLDGRLGADVAGMSRGQARYSVMCRPDGGIVDDLYVYRCADHFMLVVNASNVSKDLAWLRERCPSDVEVVDRSEETALLALQGPKAPSVLKGHVPDQALEMPANRFVEGPLFGVPALIARTGYTGEDGFELYFKEAHAATVWSGILGAGEPAGVEPIGLGARDTLRLEMAYMLYGNDIDDTTSPLEAGLSWTLKLGKADFVGAAALARQKQEGLRRKLVGLAADGRRVPRHGMVVESQGRAVGHVTSGAFGPSLGGSIAMAYVEAQASGLGTALEVVAGSSRIATRVVKRPFYTSGSRR